METIKNEEMKRSLLSLGEGEVLMVNIDRNFILAIKLLDYQLESFENTLGSIKRNRYNLFNETNLLMLLDKYEEKSTEKNKLINCVLNNIVKCERAINFLNENKIGYRMNSEVNMITFFKKNKSKSERSKTND